ncbi:unnamed protein product [Chrysoparadoxa australica]
MEAMNGRGLTQDDGFTLTQSREYELACLRQQNHALQEEVVRMRQLVQHLALAQAGQVEKKVNQLFPAAHTVEDKGRVFQKPMGRTASMATQEALRHIPAQGDALAASVIQAFRNPLGSVEYLSSQLFTQHLVQLCAAVKVLLEQESRCLFMQSPVYVFGDIHGNLEDLRFFSDNIWKLGLPVTAGKFLFLGDYVDRGMHSVEVVAYVFALKLQCPDKVFLLRGNHELRDVNGWEAHYGQKSFLWQCKNRFGPDIGPKMWEEVNQVFDRLPVSAVIDNDIFCVHGGIPQPSLRGSGNRIEDILMLPPVAGVSPFYPHEDEETVRICSECLWSDPAKESQETSLDETGYGASPRGAGAVCFGNKAVNEFLDSHNLSYIVRAHEAHAEGVNVCKGARVLTVFSTSKDHNQGKGALAGCLLVDNDRIQVINRSAKYTNKVIRRQCSALTMGLPQQWTEQGRRLGLIVDTASSNDLLKKVPPRPGGMKMISNLVSTAFGAAPSHPSGAPTSPPRAALAERASPNSTLSPSKRGCRERERVSSGQEKEEAARNQRNMNGLNSRDEDKDATLIDVFVDNCDLDEECSSDEEGYTKVSQPGAPSFTRKCVFLLSDERFYRMQYTHCCWYTTLLLHDACKFVTIDCLAVVRVYDLIGCSIE